VVDGQDKSRLTAGLLGIFLGSIGVHRFYLGYTSIGVLQILVTIATFGLGALWGMIEGVLILSGSGITTDADGRPLRP
jgi:TM2 domain-containing membrane protein YozV